jgi:pantetheine-phosphate adenylyltransferase
MNQKGGILFLCLDAICSIEDLLEFSVIRCPNLLIIVLENIDRVDDQSVFDSRTIIDFIRHFYTICIRKYYQIHQSLIYNVNVILHPFCGYDPILSPDVNTIICYRDDIVLDQINLRRSQMNLSPLSIQIYKSETIRSQIPIVHSSFNIKLSNRTFRLYRRVVLGGTFDHLHIGHKLLISQAILASNNTIVCGICDGELLNNKEYPEYLQDISIRATNVIQFSKLFRQPMTIEIIPITDYQGTSTVDDNLDAIIVSLETVKGAHNINEIRVRNGLSPLEIMIVDIVSTIEHIDCLRFKVSSTEIRKQLFKKLRGTIR